MNAFTKLSSLITTDDIEKNESAIELAKAISGGVWLSIAENPTEELVTDALIYARSTLAGINHSHCLATPAQQSANQENIDRAIMLLGLLTVMYSSRPTEQITTPLFENINTLLCSVRFDTDRTVEAAA
jgi:hypothetical protein